MNIGFSGLGSQLALKLAEKTRTDQETSIQKEVQYKRAAEEFRAQAGSIKTPAELVKNFEVYSFVMRAFDLEDQIFGKAMIRKILESDINDSNSLVNRLTDPRFKDLYKTLGFATTQGLETSKFNDPAFQDIIVDKYVDRVFIDRQAEQNSAVGTVLDFREKVGGINTWYDVLKDTELTKFFQTALALPSALSGLDVDKQKAILEKKYDLVDLADPAALDKLVDRYLLFSDLENTDRLFASNLALQLFRPIGYDAQFRSFVPETLEIPSISFSASSLYR
jgi:uncharacterized protein DUF1217